MCLFFFRLRETFSEFWFNNPFGLVHLFSLKTQKPKMSHKSPMAKLRGSKVSNYALRR